MNPPDLIAQAAGHCPPWLLRMLEWVQTSSDLLGMTAITVALLVSTARWLAAETRLLRQTDMTSRWRALGGIRVFLGNYILFGLEFMIVSDLIHSFLKPDLESLAQLGAIVLIRTFIGYVLGKEIESARQEASFTPRETA